MRQIADVDQIFEDENMERPSVEEWLKEAREEKSADRCGMYLTHIGTVRKTPRSKVRGGDPTDRNVVGMSFDFDKDAVDEAIRRTLQMKGIYCVKVWLNKGMLRTGDEIMQVLVGGDIRDHVLEALTSLVSELKTNCVKETEIYAC